MRGDIEALHQLAKIATQGFADEETLTQAASIIRRATGVAQAMVVYAENQDFLVCTDAGDGAATDFTQTALWIVQRQIIELGGPVAFNLVGHRVEDFTSACSDEEREFLALSVPTSESASEMCILRGAPEHKGRATVLRFMESAAPALTMILERFLNAERGRRLGEQLRTLANAAQVLTRSEDVEAALRDLATATSASTGFEYIVNIDLYDATTGRFFLRILSEHRHTSKSLGQFWGASLNPDRPDPWNMEVMTTLKPSFRPDMQNDPVYPEHVRKYYARSLLRSAAAFPLLFQDEFLGTMSFVSFKPRTFPPEEVSLLQGFVTQAATALKALQMHNELQQYARDLKRSADEYIATTNLTGDLIARLDKHGNWTFLNDAACQFFGKPREELIGTDSRAFLHPDDLEPTAQGIRETRATKALATGFVNRQLTPMGTRVVEWNGYALFDEDGQYAGVQITGRDITERKQMEEALAAKTQEYIDTANLTGVTILKLDKDGRVAFLNDATCQFLGRPEEEILGAQITDYLHPEDAAAATQALREMIKSKSPIMGVVSRYLTPMGTRVAEWNARPLFDEEGQYAGLDGTGRDITERKEAEERIRESEEKFKNIFQGASDPIIYLDTSGTILDVNDKAVELFGGPREELLGTHFTEVGIFQPSDLPTLMTNFAGMLSGKKPTVEVCIEDRNGQERFLDCSASSLKGDGKAPHVVIVVARDITERKQMEEALRESEERFRLAINATKDGLWEWDIQTNQEFFSPRWCEIVGYSFDDPELPHTYTSWASRIHPDDYDRVVSAMNNHLQKGTKYDVDYRHRHKSGEYRWQNSKGQAIFDESGKPIKMIGCISDITERKRAEEALRESEARYRLLTENTSDLIWTIDLGLRYTYMSPAITRMRGYTPEEVVGVPVAETMTPASLEAARKTLAEQLAMERMEGVDPNRSTKMELEMYCKDGSTIWTEMSMVFLRDSDGKPVGILGVTRNISERKRMEEELRESRQVLENITQGITETIFLLSKDFEILWANNAVLEQTGYEMAHVLGKHCYEVTHHRESPCDGRLDPCPIYKLQKTGEPVTATHTHFDAEGKEIFVDVCAYPIRDEKGEIVQFVHMSRDVTERKKAEQERDRLHAELAERAITDGLTGLYNHAHFYQRLAEEIERSKRYDRGFAVVIMDVDNFKQYNDSRGHQAGDVALRLIADCVRAGVRRSDLAFRYGGDEFAALLLNANSSRAQAVVNRINRRIAARLKEMDDPAAPWLGLSAGVASFPEDATTVDELVKMADAALYNAKRLAWARGMTEEGQAIQPPAPSPGFVHETQTRVLSTAASSLATVLQDLGACELAPGLDVRAIAAVGAASEIRDRYIHGHQERTALWAAALAEEMGLLPERVRNIRIAGLLHDLGKVTVNERILNKPGKLTEEEFAKVKQHASRGAAIIISEAEALQQLAPIVRHHHERFGGKGYPDGLAGEEIPIEARILAVADVFDAMTHERAYRKALSREEAIAELERSAGTQFDPAVVEAFLALVKRPGEEPPALARAASADRQLAAARAAGRTNG